MREGLVVSAASMAATPALPFLAQLRILLAQRRFALISLVSFGAAFARTGALFTVIPLLGRARLGLAPDQIGLGLGLISVVGLALAYPSGVLVDRFGRKVVIVPATVLTGLALLLFAAAPSYLWFIGACAVRPARYRSGHPGAGDGVARAPRLAYAED